LRWLKKSGATVITYETLPLRALKQNRESLIFCGIPKNLLS
jgi:hypothetical protein